MARTMKDSGIEWIGMIPENWSIRKLKSIAKIQTGNTPDKNNAVFYSEEGMRWVKSDNLNGFIPVSDTVEKLSEEGVKVARVASKGSTLVCCIGSIGKYGIIDEDMAYNQQINAVTFNNDIVIDKFGSYLISISESQHWLYANGNVLKILNNEGQGKIVYAIPTILEQQKIVDFLDDRIGEVDTIISKTKASIEEYKKYKQAVITEVALGGLDKAVTTKNSGIDWIGNIPEHWKIKPFKFVMTERNEKNIPVKTDERLALSIDKGITTYAEKTTNLDRFKDDVTQYKLAYEGDLVFNSMNMIVGAIGYSNYFGCVSPVYYTYYDNAEGHYTSKYYEYIFRSKTMRKVLFSLGKGIMAIDRGDDKINTCRLKVSRDDLRCLKVPVPTEQEQQEIVKYLDAKCVEIEVLIAKKEAFVEEMEAYKKSLIYEYVTGKKEV